MYPINLRTKEENLLQILTMNDKNTQQFKKSSLYTKLNVN